MTIREATAADLDAVLTLERTCFALDPWSRHMLDEELVRPGGIFLVAEDAGIAGFAIAWAVLGELHVLQVAVAPARRRSGIGRKLVDALEARARVEAAWLEVRRDNPAAIALYQGLGYRYVATRARYYDDGVDALVYRKEAGGRRP